MIYLASFVLGAFVNLFAGIFVMWAIMYKIMDLVGYEKRTLRSAYLLGMVGFTAQVGMIYLPFHASGLMYVGFLTATTGLTIAYGKYILYQTICGLVMMLGFAAVGKFILRLDFSAMADSKNFEYLGGKKLTFEQKFGLFDLVLLVVILLAPDFLPETSGIYTLLKTLGVAGAFGIAMAIPAIIKNKEGKPLMDIAACTKSASWDVVWLLVATMPIATVMQSEDCGIVKTVVTAVIGLCGDMHWILFTILTTIVLGLATQVTHNLILAVVLFGPLAVVCQQLGGNPVVWFMINYWVNMAAFVTPAGSATSAIVHGNSEWLKPKDAYLMGTLWLILNIVLGLIVGVTIGSLIF